VSSQEQTILVTGGAGYIGSHAALALKKAGYNVIILDNLSYGHQEIVDDVLQVKLIIGDTSDRTLLDQLFTTHKIDGVIHFAAYIAVGESVQEPGKYYSNNVASTLNLLEAMLAHGINKIVFSSTCAVYGMPQEVPMTESHPHNPLSPYAASKDMVERILSDFDTAFNLKSVAFRYFNAETHLIPLALLTALKKRETLYIFGTDYDTPDGTCVRDYIHVNDLADAHVLGLKYLLAGGASEVFNLGNGNGFSVREVIETAREVTGLEIPVVESDRRAGDAPILVGSSQKVREMLGWNPNYADLKQIISHAWQWHQKRHGD